MVAFTDILSNDNPIMVDTFSKKAWARPLKNKTGRVVSDAINSVITENGHPPTRLWTDDGTEFFNKIVKKM